MDKKTTISVLKGFKIQSSHHLFEIKLANKYITKHLKPIFIYNFSIKNIKQNRYELTYNIPYYLSDAHTNHFRSNTLLPFICLNDNKTSSVSCPKNTEYANGLLFKYQIMNNTCTHLIHNSIIDKMDASEKKLYRKEMSTKLVSYLPRLTNFLDFMIGILLNKKIKNITTKTDESEFMPFYSKNLNDIFIKNPSVIRTTTYENELGRDKIRGFHGNRESTYRKYLMDELKSYNEEFSNILQNIHNIKLEFTNVNLNNLNQYDKNTLISPNICKSGKVNIEAELNFYKYREFSFRFYALMKYIINSIDPTLKIARLLDDDMNKCKYKTAPRSLSDHIRNWKAACITEDQQNYLISRNLSNINKALNDRIYKLNERLKKLYNNKNILHANIKKANVFIKEAKKMRNKLTNLRLSTTQINKRIMTETRNLNNFKSETQKSNQNIHNTNYTLQEAMRELSIINNLPLLFQKYNQINNSRKKFTSEDKKRLEELYNERSWYKLNDYYDKIIYKQPVPKRKNNNTITLRKEKTKKKRKKERKKLN